MRAFPFLSNPILRRGILFGFMFGAVGTVFTLLSVLMPFDRQVWLRLFDLNGITMFGLCFTAAVIVGRETGGLGAGISASILASIVGTLIYSIAEFVVPYALFDQLVAYPFLHEDFGNSGIPTIKEYLLSGKGYWGVVETSVGMLQYAIPVSALIAAVFGIAGAALGKLKPGNGGQTRLRLMA